MSESIMELVDGLILQSTSAGVTEMRAAIESAIAALDAHRSQEPIPMLLWCPKCHTQHVDAPSEGWDNPPHRSHLCHSCGCVWRPAAVETNGVAAIETRGSRDTWDGTHRSQQQAGDDEIVEAMCRAAGWDATRWHQMRRALSVARRMDGNARDRERPFTFSDGLKVAEGVFEDYRARHPKWWKRMDGTPILNDVAVLMAQAFVAAMAREGE